MLSVLFKNIILPKNTMFEDKSESEAESLGVNSCVVYIIGNYGDIL